MDTSLSTSSPSRRDRWQVGYRMTCEACQVAWTGADTSRCWVCDEPGVAGPPPILYPITSR